MSERSVSKVGLFSLVVPLSALLFAAPLSGQQRPPAPTGADGDACLAAAPRTFGALNERIAQLERANVRYADVRCALAVMYAKDGRLDAAQDLVATVVRDQPTRVGAQILLAQVLQKSARAQEARAAIERLSSDAARLVEARLLQASIVPAEQRTAAFESIAADHPTSATALVALAGEYNRLKQDSATQSLLDRALSLQPDNADAHVLYAQVHQRARRPAEQRASLNRALALDSLSVAARDGLATLIRSEGNRDSAFRLTVVNARLDPYFFNHGGLAQGGSRTSWTKYPPYADDSVPPPLVRALVAADSLLTRKQLDAADAAYRAILRSYPGDISARVGIGTVHYYRKQYEQSAAVFRSVAHDAPGFGLAHFGVSQSEKMSRDARNPALQASVQRFKATPTPPEPVNLRDVFPDYDRLNDDYKKIVLLSIAPLSNYIPVLAAGGATFQLLPFQKRLWELPNKQRTRGRYTFDLRLWDDVKGQGGFFSVGGEEWMGDVLYERFNVLAHEFFHQVHTNSFTDEQKKEITEMYRRAKREKRTLDSYADQNEFEYMAQAYEAWISEQKTTTGGTGSNTRAKVTRQDSAAVRFLEGVNSLPSYRENELVAIPGGINALVGDGNLAAARARASAALTKYGDHPLLLSAMSSVLRLQGDYAAARELDTRAIRLFPDRANGYEALATEHILASHDYVSAAATVARYLERDPKRDQTWLELAEHQIAALQLDSAERSLKRASDLIGEPNPVARYHAQRGAIALMRGDTATARQSYEFILNNIARDNTQALTDLALISAAAGKFEAARVHLTTALTVNPRSPVVQETSARVLAAEGKRQQAIDALLVMLEEDPRRIETYTALLTVAPNDARASAWRAAGRQLIQAKEPVRFVYRREQWVQQGRLSARSIADFEAAAKRIPTS